MPSLKSLRMRIKSIKATQKITSAMKMVAASKLRRSQEKAEGARPYAYHLSYLLQQSLRSYDDNEGEPSILLKGNDSLPHLLVVCTSDRGLCGGFNSSIIREARNQIKKIEDAGQRVFLFVSGKKGKDGLMRDHGSKIIDTKDLNVPVEFGKKGPVYEDALKIAAYLENLVKKGEVGRISIVYSLFKTVLTQVVTVRHIVPFTEINQGMFLNSLEKNLPEIEGESSLIYRFEPSAQDVANGLLSENLTSQLYQAFLETMASESAARMTAMDNATRNARDVIKKLELNYNRTRQACITKELIEIISGAEACI